MRGSMWIMRKSNEGVGVCRVGYFCLGLGYLFDGGWIDLVPGIRYKVPGQKVDRILD